jgi:hypothetical protein
MHNLHLGPWVPHRAIYICARDAVALTTLSIFDLEICTLYLEAVACCNEFIDLTCQLTINLFLLFNCLHRTTSLWKPGGGGETPTIMSFRDNNFIFKIVSLCFLITCRHYYRHITLACMAIGTHTLSISSRISSRSNLGFWP